MQSIYIPEFELKINNLANLLSYRNSLSSMMLTFRISTYSFFACPLWLMEKRWCPCRSKQWMPFDITYNFLFATNNWLTSPILHLSFFSSLIYYTEKIRSLQAIESSTSVIWAWYRKSLLSLFGSEQLYRHKEMKAIPNVIFFIMSFLQVSNPTIATADRVRVFGNTNSEVHSICFLLIIIHWWI